MNVGLMRFADANFSFNDDDKERFNAGPGSKDEAGAAAGSEVAAGFAGCGSSFGCSRFHASI